MERWVGDNMMTISIIICTHNRAHLLKNTLNSLFNINIPDDCMMELIVLNNASNDETSSVVEMFSKGCKKFPVRMLLESRLGKTYALNNAIKNANGEILAFVDDDHTVSKGYLKAIYKAVCESPSHNIFCGRINPDWDGTEPHWVHDNNVYPIRPFPIPNFNLGDTVVEISTEKVNFLPGAGNLFVRKTVFGKIGLFSEKLGPKGHNLRGGEDIEFVRRALSHGESILYIPGALQYHHVDKSKLTLSYLIKKAYYRSMVACQYSELNSTRKVFQIPSYLFKQAISRFVKALFVIRQDARRHYLVRLAAVLGEMQGHRRSDAIRKLHHARADIELQK